MAAPKGKEEIKSLFDEIINDIAENGTSLYSALKNRMSSQTFYAYIDSNVDESKRYTRATELRAERMADETLNIADAVDNDILVLPDGREVVNNNVINRDRLRVDTRKWLMAKLYPKKYGDKIATEHSGEVSITSMTPEEREKRIEELKAKLLK